jgi:hypothetical protein
MVFTKSWTEPTGIPFAERMTSPASNPARAPGESWPVLTTLIPLTVPSSEAMSWTVVPIHPALAGRTNKTVNNIARHIERLTTIASTNRTDYISAKWDRKTKKQGSSMYLIHRNPTFFCIESLSLFNMLIELTPKL